MCHRFEAKSILSITGQPSTQPSEERTDLIGLKIVDIGLKVLLLLRNPNAKSKAIFLTVDMNMDHAAYEEILIVDAAQIGRNKYPTFSLIFRNIEVWIRIIGADIRQSFVRFTACMAFEAHSV